MNNPYQLGLLCLTHLLISADGTIDETEIDAIGLIRQKEKISDATFSEFKALISGRKDREIFLVSIDLLNSCTTDEKLRAFVLLYKLSEVDGRVHVGEVRLLLYSIQLADIDFDMVVDNALLTPSLMTPRL